MKVQVLLADTGQQDSLNKLHLLGVGWASTSLQPTGMAPDQAVAVLIEVPWDRCNKPLPFVLELISEDGSPFLVPAGPPPAAPAPLQLVQDIVAAAPPGTPNGTPGNAHIFVSITGGLPLAPGRRYLWRARLDGETREDWEAGFFVARQQTPPRLAGYEPPAPGGA